MLYPRTATNYLRGLIVLFIETYTQTRDQCSVNSWCHDDGVRLLAKDKITSAKQLAVDARHCATALFIYNVGSMIKPSALHLQSHGLAMGVCERGGCLGADH